jgi:hypothetical protein
MERRTETELPYRKIAGWGMAASAVVTLGLLALCPLSPARMVERALDGPLQIRLGDAVTSSTVTGGADGLLSGTLSGVLDGVRVGSRPWGLVPRAEAPGGLGPEARQRIRRGLRRELRRELRGMGPELRGAVLEGLLPVVPELTGELKGIGAGVWLQGLSVDPAAAAGAI